MKPSIFKIKKAHVMILLWLIVSLACNLPSAVSNPIPIDDVETAIPDLEPTSEPPLPTEIVVEVPNPTLLLDTSPSLAEVKEGLEGISAIDKSNGTIVSGRQLLELILEDQEYDPTQENVLKENVFALLDAYELPHPGARILLINLATGLFAEAYRFYPWSLQDYSAQLVNHVFIQDSTIQRAETSYHRGDLPTNMPNLKTHWYPVENKIIEDAHFKQFNLARTLIQGANTQEEAIGLIVVWLQQNFFHAYHDLDSQYGWEVYLDGREPNSSGPAAYPLSLERIYEERVVGCHEPTILLEGMLHSLNIPAMRLSVHGHGVLYLPSLDRYIHGDHVASYTDAPIGMLLLTPDEFRPFAEDVGWLFQIYIDKDQRRLLSIPLKRDGGDLYIFARSLRDHQANTCIQVTDEYWTSVSTQLSTFNIQYDRETCGLSSDKVPILELNELNNLEIRP